MNGSMMQQRKLKVYLSKSKMGSIDSLMKVRELLSHYDIELLEFSGGEYSPKLLESADIVLVLPPNLPKAFNYNFRVGRRQYEEFAIANNSNKQEIYFIICPGDELYVSQVEDTDLLAEDWKLNYAHIWCEEMMKPLFKYEELIPYKEKTNKVNKDKPLLALYKK